MLINQAGCLESLHPHLRVQARQACDIFETQLQNAGLSTELIRIHEGSVPHIRERKAFGKMRLGTC